MRVNPPPGWPPVPPGWTPPAGWQPDPSWGPAPPGWQLWLPDQPVGPRRRGPWGWVVAGLVLVLVLAGSGYLVHSRSNDARSSIAGPLAQGEQGSIAGFSVTVTAVDLDATAALAQEGTPTTPSSGRLVLAQLSYTNTLAGDQVPATTFFPNLIGGDGRRYYTVSCLVEPADVLDSTVLAPGQTRSSRYCFDVPTTALPGSSVEVDIGANGIGWRTGG